MELSFPSGEAGFEGVYGGNKEISFRETVTEDGVSVIGLDDDTAGVKVIPETAQKIADILGGRRHGEVAVRWNGREFVPGGDPYAARDTETTAPAADDEVALDVSAAVPEPEAAPAQEAQRLKEFTALLNQFIPVSKEGERFAVDPSAVPEGAKARTDVAGLDAALHEGIHRFALTLDEEQKQAWADLAETHRDRTFTGGRFDGQAYNFDLNTREGREQFADLAVEFIRDKAENNQRVSNRAKKILNQIKDFLRKVWDTLVRTASVTPEIEDWFFKNTGIKKHVTAKPVNTQTQAALRTELRSGFESAMQQGKSGAGIDHELLMEPYAPADREPREYYNAFLKENPDIAEFWIEEVNGNFLETLWETVKTVRNYSGGGEVTAEDLAEFFRRTTSVDNKKVTDFLKRVWDNYDALSVSKDNTDIIKDHAGTADTRWREEIGSGRVFENLREIYRTIRDTPREYDNPENREQKKLLDMFIGNHVGLENFVRGDTKFDAASPWFKGLMTGLAGGAPSPTASALLFLKWCNTVSAASGCSSMAACCFKLVQHRVR